MQFEERTIKIIIDESKCLDCKTHACAAGCKLFDRGILVIKDGKPALGRGCGICQTDRYGVSGMRV